MQQLSVRHRTTYRYRRPVAFGEHRMMMRPRDSHDLRLLDATLTLQPRASRVRWLHDVFGNSVAIARFDQPADTLILESAITIERYPFVQPDYPIEDYARTLPFSYPAREVPDLGRTIERHYADPERRVTDWARRHINPVGMTQTEDFLIAITRAIQAEFRYEARSAPGVQSPVETLDQGSGTCRDFALFMMEAARSVGLAARFVSGYLYDPALDAPGRKNDAASPGPTVGAGASHAWVQVYLPGAGWIEFDPTNGAHGGHNLVPIAVAREPGQALPVVGTYDGTADDLLGMEVEVSVRRLQVAPAA